MQRSHSSSAPIPLADLKQAFDLIVSQILRPGAIGLGVLYILFAIAHWKLLPDRTRMPMTWLAFGSAVVLFAVALVLERRKVAARFAHRIVAAIAGVVLLNSLAHAYLTKTPTETMNLKLLAIGAGCILLSYEWLALILAASVAGWAMVVSLTMPPPFISHLDFGLLGAVVLAVIIHWGRFRACAQIEQLRLINEGRSLELQKALQSAELEIGRRKQMEADLERARVELESRVAQRTSALAAANETLRKEIDERERIESALRKSEASLLLAQRVAKIGSWELDLKTCQLTWSAETYRIFGHSPDSFVPSRSSFLSAVHAGDRAIVENAMSAAMSNMGVYSVDHRIVRPGGEERIVHEQADLVTDATGQAIKIAGTVQDVTKVRKLEVQLRQSQKMEGIGQLAAGVAHDFNNLLTILRGELALLGEGGLSESDQRELLDEIAETIDRGANLTKQLLLFSRKQVLQMRVLNLDEVIANLVKILERVLGDEITLKVQLAGNLPAIEADSTMLEQLLMNLLLNARQATAGGGEVAIATEAVEPAAEQRRMHPDCAESMVRLTVRDEGCGIAPAVLPRIFEPFFTTKPLGSGTGLGLSTVYGIVKQHRGWIEVASELNRGTTFSVYLPASSKAAEPLRQKQRPELKPVKTATVLLVDDEPELRRIMSRLLERSGFSIKEAGSGGEALSLYEQDASIDLLVTDLSMPGGISGQALAETLRLGNPGLRVVYMSGYSADWTQLQKSLGCRSRFLAKPFPPRDLLAVIQECLQEE